jgi:hypothetical protein
MVKQGKFTIQLVNANGGIPFPEHTKENGEVYVEVEPDAEYYIRVEGDSEDLVRMDFEVDGKSLGYNSTMSKTSPAQDKGIWEYKDGKSYIHALKFAKANVQQDDGRGGATPYWTGMVEVTVHEAIENGYKEQRDHSNKWNGGDVSFVMGISDPDKKKGVKSDKGETFTAHKSKRRRTTFAQGGLRFVTVRHWDSFMPDCLPSHQCGICSVSPIPPKRDM